jgi:radical SAM-linked protein
LAGDPNTIAVSQAQNKPVVARVRVVYSKLGQARFLGAREITTLFARAVRRARLPVAYSQGFHPLPRLSFGPALPVGIESEEEFLDIELSEPLAAEEVSRRLNAELPCGFTVHWAETIDLRAASIDVSIGAFRYAVALDSLPADKQGLPFLAARLSEFRASATFPMRKQTRSGEKLINAKQFVSEVALTAPLTLILETKITRAGMIKPHEFIGVLFGLTVEQIKILRLKKIQTLFHPSAKAVVEPVSKEGHNTPLQIAAN